MSYILRPYPDVIKAAIGRIVKDERIKANAKRVNERRIEMQELEKILEEIEQKQVILKPFDAEDRPTGIINVDIVKEIIRKHINDGWIPVEERLPEEYGEYLVTIVPLAGYLWAKRIIANFSDLMGIVKKPIFYTGEVGKIDFEDITDMVIAWRPLPEPYRPERSEGE